MNTIKTTYRKDYTPPIFAVDHIDLHFTLGETSTFVRNKMTLRRTANSDKKAPLMLDGKNLILKSVILNGEPVAHQQTDEHLVIENVPDQFSLDILTEINPQANTTLEGLYWVNQLFCTQCEAQGFRRITYYLDRPDVMTTFTTTIIADKKRYPVLLSNGNCIAQKELPNDQHSVTWQDPFKKPCYLFALVGGDLACLRDTFTTMSGRQVQIHLYVDHGDEDKSTFALEAIKHAMRWDEENFGREYDLDIFMVVATHHFNMGAMENKGLNIFNSKYILAKPETATDDDYTAIERVIGHEYFHNWTGNRITCRDWFQLSLKESLTVFRDSQFSADMTSPAVVRISDVINVRNLQFPQDAGPMAHPVRPESYIEMNNFYTVTIYEKGAEIIRMLWTLLGKTGFRKGMDLYFARYDGQAVCIEEFVQAHADANHQDLTQFMRWYSQAGTPDLTVTSTYNAQHQEYQLTVTQSCPPTPGQPHKDPFYLPLRMGLLNTQGKEITSDILIIKEPQQTFTFKNILEMPVPSLLRDFSAPVKLHYNYQDDALAFLLAHDTDPFARWDAGQQLAVNVIKRLLAQENTAWQVDEKLLQAWQSILQDEKFDANFAAFLLLLPAENYLIEILPSVDLDKLFAARHWLRQTLTEKLQPLLLARYTALAKIQPYHYDAANVGRRALKNRCLSYLSFINNNDAHTLIEQQFTQANNMTDQLAALSAISHTTAAQRDTLIAAFYEQWQKEALVVDKWFGIQARSELPGTLDRVKALLTHPAFDIKNPNKVRALIGSFCQNLPQFHAKDGSGYQFLTDQIIKLNDINPLIAARLTEPFTRWRKYDMHRQQLMQTALQRLQALPNLAKDVYEVVSKSL